MVLKGSIVIERNESHFITKKISRLLTSIDEFMNNEAIPVITIPSDIESAHILDAWPHRRIRQHEATILICPFVEPGRFAFENRCGNHEFPNGAQTFIPGEEIVDDKWADGF